MSKPDNPLEAFTYTADSGAKVNLLPFSRIPSGVFRKTRNLDEMEQMFALLEAGAVSDDDLEGIDALPVFDLADVFQKWSDASEEGLHPKS